MPTDDSPSTPAAPIDVEAEAEAEAEAAAVASVIARRRTSLLVDPEGDLPEDQLDRLISAATMAPNHKRTWPWRFTVLTGEARGRFGEALAEAGAATGLDPGKVAKLPGKYRRSPAVVLVWVAAGPDPIRAREDRDATAAAVQNLLLAATAEGLASYWASVPDALIPAVRGVADLSAEHDLVALVYLGRPTGEVPAPPRPAPQVTWLRR